MAGRRGRARGLALLLVALLPAPVAPAGNEMAEARRLLASERGSDRIKGLEILGQHDGRPAVQLGETVIEKCLKQLDRLAVILDKQDAEVSGWFIEAYVLEATGNGGTARHRSARARLDHAEASQRVTLLEAELELLTMYGIGEELATYRSAEALREIEVGARTDSNPTARRFFLEALARPECVSSVPVLTSILGQTDLRNVSGALRALVPHASAPGVMDAIRPFAKHDHWALRLGAYRVIACGPPADAIAALVEAIAREEGEMAFACDSYLEELTGRSFAERPADWAGWWKENEAAVRGGSYAPPEANAPAAGAADSYTVARFFRIPIESRRVVFALDCSGSMLQELDLDEARLVANRSRHGLPATRMGCAQAELIAAVQALPDGALFNIVAYEDRAVLFQPKLVRAGRTTRESATKWILKREATYLTNLWDALRQSFRDYLASPGGDLRFHDVPDTIVFLTDGNATRGRFRSGESIVRCFHLWNSPIDTVVHCVGIGADQDRPLLERLSAMTGGYYVDPQKGTASLQRRRRLPARGLPPAGGKGG